MIIDTDTLEKDKKGNVRVELDKNGRTAEVCFYGIDMPESIRQFKK